MDVMNIKEQVMGFGKKYKYVILIFLIGLLLMLLPAGMETKQEETVISQSSDHILTVEDRLEQILSLVQGAGEVEVMLTVAYGEETVYQTNDQTSSNQGTSSMELDTVLITDSDRNQHGLIRQINAPVYMGAIVICQGADDNNVKLAIVEAVAKITGLGTDKITVMKRK